MDEELIQDALEHRMVQAVYEFVHSQFPELAESGEVMNFSIKFRKEEEGDGVSLAYLICDSDGGILHDEGDYFSDHS